MLLNLSYWYGCMGNQSATTYDINQSWEWSPEIYLDFADNKCCQRVRDDDTVTEVSVQTYYA